MDKQAAQREVQRLEKQISELAKEQEQCQQEVLRLMDQEIGQGVSLAVEIHQAKQRRMMLATQSQHLKARLNALLMSGA